MKKFTKMMALGLLAVALVGCATDTTQTDDTKQTETAAGAETTGAEQTEEAEAPQTVVVSVSNAEGTYIDVEFPFDPQRIVVLNYQTLDFLDAMGLGDRVVGTIGGASMPEHLQHYATKEGVAQLGGMKDYDIEAIMSLQPDVIFSSDRSRSAYDDLSIIAPTMSAYVNYEMGFFDSFKDLAARHGKIFGLEGELDEVIKGYEERIAAINEFAGESTALLGLFTGEAYHTLGDTGRASIITNEMGFNNLAAEIDVNHGNVSSYELMLQLNPDYMFILDKDAAVAAEATLAQQLMDNDIVKETEAYKNGRIIYLEPGSAWYLADGGIGAMDLMITNIEEGLGLK